MGQTTTPSLANAYLRLTWGRNRLRELVTSHDDLCAANARTIVPNPDIRTALVPGDARSVAFVDTTRFTPVPDCVSQLASETALHFRGALDYMVGQLSILDTPNVSGQKRRTQFPIEDLESQFDGQRSRYLCGINDDHVASLRALQPFNGCSWTRLLRDLSNHDKHNDLILTQTDVMVSGGFTPTPGADGNSGHGELQFRLLPVLQIVLGEGPQLIESLQTIESQVARTLDLFAPGFKT